jgi:hypothetical protein
VTTNTTTVPINTYVGLALEGVFGVEVDAAGIEQAGSGWGNGWGNG